MASATSVALRSSTRLLQAGSALRSRFVPRQCISIARSFCVDAAQSGQSTSSTATAPDTPTLWQLKSPAALEPLTSPETLKGHEKGLLLEKEDLFCRRMARTWEVVANAVWTKGSKAEQLLEEACGQQLFDRFVALRKAKTGYKSRMTVKSSELVDYLEFVNVADSKGSVVRHGFDPAMRVMVTFDSGLSAFAHHAGAFMSALMASGNTPTLGHFVSGTRVFVRAKVKFECVEQIGEQEVPSTHVATFEMPFEAVIWDQLTETTAQGSKSKQDTSDSKEGADAPSDQQGAGTDAAAPGAGHDSDQAQEEDASQPAEEEDELDLPPLGTFKGDNGLPMAVAADGRPVGVMGMGPVAPVAGWRMVDINGHQPVTASQYDFVSAMLSRRGNLFPEGDGDDSDSSDDEPESKGAKQQDSPSEKR